MDKEASLPILRHQSTRNIHERTTAQIVEMLMRGDPRAWDFIRHDMPTFPTDDTHHTGERWCGGCKAWHAIQAFGKDSSRSDGIAYYCREHRKKQRTKHKERVANWYDGAKRRMAKRAAKKAV